MHTNPVRDRNGEELPERGLRELTADEAALVGGGMHAPPDIWPYPKVFGPYPTKFPRLW